MTEPIRIELPIQYSLGTVNAYLFTNPEPVLIDTGVKSDASWQALQTGLAAHDLTVADLTKVIITHPHTDHCGQIGQLLAISNAEIWIADIGVNWLINFADEWQQRVAYYRDEFLPGVALPSEVQQMIVAYFEQVSDSFDTVPIERVRTFQVSDFLEMGGLSWQVLHTPGHATTQTCFYQPETRQFISSDMLLHKTPTPVVEPPSKDGKRVPALPEFLHSLDLVEGLDIAIVYPGHGEPFHDYRGLIRRQRERIHARKVECFNLIKEGHHTVAELINIMYADRPPQVQMAGLWMLIGYLDLLLADGVIEKQTQAGVWYYHSKWENKKD